MKTHLESRTSLNLTLIIELQTGRSIAKTEEHDEWFKESAFRDEGCFPFISFFDPDVVVSPANVDDCEEFRCLEFGTLEDFG